MSDLPRFREPMCGWPKDAFICVNHALPSTVCGATAGDDRTAAHLAPFDPARPPMCTCGRPGLATPLHLTPCQLRDNT